jgi:hypothetical protein
VLRRAAPLLLIALVAAGCGGDRPHSQLFAVTQPFEAASAVTRVDPETLRPLGRSLRLPDVVTRPVLSRDGRMLALGGGGFGEVVFVDMSRQAVVKRMKVVRVRYAGEVAVDVEGWPRASRLVAVATVAGAWSTPHPSRLLLVDPTRRRVVQRTPLHGTVASAVSLRDGTTALLVLGGRVPSLVVVPPTGPTWVRPLPPLDRGGGDGVRVAGIHLAPRHDPALATDGRRVFVVATDRPIAEILPGAHVVRYHSVPIPRMYLDGPPATASGTGGVHLRYTATAVWLGKGRLAIGGDDELPSALRGGGIGHRVRVRGLEIVDTRIWRWERGVRAGFCERSSGATLCRATVYRPNGRRDRGAGLVAYDSRWRRLYVKHSTEVRWTVVTGRLFVGRVDGGRRLRELDPATGAVLRNVADVFPADFFVWQPS